MKSNMKATIIILVEMLAGVLTCFFSLLAILTPWCAWKIVCIVLAAVLGCGFITTFVLSRMPKYQFNPDEQGNKEPTDEENKEPELVEDKQ